MKHSLVFTAYNRPTYFSDSINSWNGARNLRNWETSAFIEPSDVVDEMSDIALRLQTDVTVNLNESLQGVLINPWNALDSAFNAGADFVVLAEDDVIVSQDTLEYFEWTAIEYETNHKALLVNAYSNIGGGKDNQILTDTRFSPLIWGIWRNRWENIIRDTWDKDYSTGLPDGSQAGWDWNINRIIQANDYRVVRPLNSRSDHIGEEGGTHMTPDLFPSSRGVDFVQARGRQRYNEI